VEAAREASVELGRLRLRARESESACRWSRWRASRVRVWGYGWHPPLRSGREQCDEVTVTDVCVSRVVQLAFIHPAPISMPHQAPGNHTGTGGDKDRRRRDSAHVTCNNRTQWSITGILILIIQYSAHTTREWATHRPADGGQDRVQQVRAPQRASPRRAQPEGARGASTSRGPGGRAPPASRCPRRPACTRGRSS